MTRQPSDSETDRGPTDTDAAPRVTFAEWRRTRPVWSGALLALGGGIVAWFPLRSLVSFGTSVTTGLGLLVGVGIVFVGVAVLARPDHTEWLGLAGLVLSVASLPLVLGGLVVGMLVSAAGAVLAFAWSPPDGPSRRESRG